MNEIINEENVSVENEIEREISIIIGNSINKNEAVYHVKKLMMGCLKLAGVDNVKIEMGEQVH